MYILPEQYSFVNCGLIVVAPSVYRVVFGTDPSFPEFAIMLSLSALCADLHLS